jgi:hypothetical protein
LKRRSAKGWRGGEKATASKKADLRFSITSELHYSTPQVEIRSLWGPFLGQIKPTALYVGLYFLKQRIGSTKVILLLTNFGIFQQITAILWVGPFDGIGLTIENLGLYCLVEYMAGVLQ